MNRVASHFKPFLHIYHTTKYEQRMRRLSCKIFNDFYIPELTKAELDYGTAHNPVQLWMAKWHSDLRVVQRHSQKPFDLDDTQNQKYYPAHPQIRGLTNVLREYGLFRDEHRDFNEAMKQKDIARGRVFRERRGPHSKGDKKKK